MQKNQLVIALLLVLSAGLHAQQIAPSVVSTSGGFYSNSSGMLSFTTGELAAVATYTTPGSILTQGFQQAWDFSTAVNDYPNSTFGFGVYPNPSDGNFYLVTETEDPARVTMRVIDLLGKEIYSKAFDQSTEMNVESFDLSRFASGTYMIALDVNQTAKPQEHFINKIQIIR